MSDNMRRITEGHATPEEATAAARKVLEEPAGVFEPLRAYAGNVGARLSLDADLPRYEIGRHPALAMLAEVDRLRGEVATLTRASEIDDGQQWTGFDAQTGNRRQTLTGVAQMIRAAGMCGNGIVVSGPDGEHSFTWAELVDALAADYLLAVEEARDE